MEIGPAIEVASFGICGAFERDVLAQSLPDAEFLNCDLPSVAERLQDPESFYLPGTRGMFWFKLKRELATLDVVVVAAELGHGKRNDVLSDYTFAVRDETSGELLPIGKAYSGLTDAEIAELTKHFKKNTVAEHGRYREVKPDVVLEVAFNSIQPSRRHASGLALRFPRIKAIRRDKDLGSIDTLQYARELASQSSSTGSLDKQA